MTSSLKKFKYIEFGFSSKSYAKPNYKLQVNVSTVILSRSSSLSQK